MSGANRQRANQPGGAGTMSTMVFTAAYYPRDPLYSCPGRGRPAAMTTGVFFDLDGTLVDTPYLHTVTWWQALRQFEHDVAMARIHRAIGMGGDRILDHLLGPDHDRADDDAIRAAHTSLYAIYWHRLRPTPGARQLVRA